MLIQWFRNNILKETYIDLEPLLSTLRAFEYFETNPSERLKATRDVEEIF